MRLLLVITLLISPLPTKTYGRTVTPARPVVESSAPVPDQTPTPTPTPDPVLEQAKREAAIADELKKKAVADKERAEAEAERLKALALPFGTPSNVQVPTGSVTTDAAGWVESQMLAQEAARQITARLTRTLCNGNFMPGGIALTPVSTPAPSTLPQPAPTPTPARPTDSINTLVIYNNTDLAGVELYNTVAGQLDKLNQEFRGANQKARDLLAATDPNVAPTAAVTGARTSALAPVLAAPGIATGLIKSVAELINLFRTDTRFENKTVQISEDMVVSHVVHQLTNGGAGGRCPGSIKVYYPALYPPLLVNSSASSPLVALLNEVEREKNEAALLVERIDNRIKELNQLRAKLEDLEKKGKAKGAKAAELKAKEAKEPEVCGGRRRRNSPECKKLIAEIEALRKEVIELEKAIAELDAALKPNIKANAAATNNFEGWPEKLAEQKSRMQALINSTDLLSSRLNTPDANTKLTALAQLLRAEKLNQILADPQTFTLRVAVNANGTTKIKKNLFVDAKVRHSAGANLVYQLFNRDGALAQGDVMQCYIDYRSAQDVFDVVSGADTVECRSAARPSAGSRVSAGVEGNR